MLHAEHANVRRNARSDVLECGVDGEFAADVPETGRMDGVRTAGLRTAEREAQRDAADRAEHARDLVDGDGRRQRRFDSTTRRDFYGMR